MLQLWQKYFLQKIVFLQIISIICLFKQNKQIKKAMKFDYFITINYHKWVGKSISAELLFWP